jgi:hypothetical protein
VLQVQLSPSFAQVEGVMHIRGNQMGGEARGMSVLKLEMKSQVSRGVQTHAPSDASEPVDLAISRHIVICGLAVETSANLRIEL